MPIRQNKNKGVLKMKYKIELTPEEYLQINTALMIMRIHFEDEEMPITDELIKRFSKLPF